MGGQLHAPSALSLGKSPPSPIGWEAGWAPKLVWTLWREKSGPCWESNPGRPARSLSLSRLLQRKGKVLGSEEGRMVGRHCFMVIQQRDKVEQGLHWVRGCMSSMQCSPAFAGGPSKTTATFIELAGGRTSRMQPELQPAVRYLNWSCTNCNGNVEVWTELDCESEGQEGWGCEHGHGHFSSINLGIS
jgi:hypothetical protein